MILFISKTIVALVLLYLAFCFYGQVTDHLFIKLLFSVFLLMTMYFVDIYRFSKIFSTYFVATRCYRHGDVVKAYALFERLIGIEFAPALPYAALMKFTGKGTTVNVDAAKYFCERAIRNDYSECLYLLAVINFFGDSLTKYFGGKIITSEYSDEFLHSHGVKTHHESVEADYKECLFHLNAYFNKNNKKEKNYADACALYGYCLVASKGCERDNEQGERYLRIAKEMHSKNIRYLENCLQNNSEVYEYSL